MPDSYLARKLRNYARRENILHVAQAFVHVNVGTVSRSDAGGFLPTMLQRVKPEISHFRSLEVPKNSEHSAMVVKMIVVELYQTIHACISESQLSQYDLVKFSGTNRCLRGLPACRYI